MNKIVIVGNLCSDPELRSTPDGKSVCNFNVAVNRRKKPGKEQETDFFRISAWNGQAESCSKFLTKGSKVGIIGSVSVHPYKDRSGEARATIEVLADDVEFISTARDKQTGFEKVDEEVPY